MNNIYHTKEKKIRKFYIGGIRQWEIAHVTVKFFGSLSYSYYFSVVALTTTVDATMDVASYLLKSRKVQSILWKEGHIMPENRGCGCGCNGFGFGGDCIWIIIVLILIFCCCGNNNNGCGCC